MKVVIFHPYLAPYRIDFFNALSEYFELKVFFAFENDPLQNFDLSKLSDRIKFDYGYNKRGEKLFRNFYRLNRQLRFGLHNIVKKEHPNVVVSHEFGFISLYLLFLSQFSASEFRLYITTDDSPDVFRNSSLLRKLAIRFVSRRVSGLIFSSTATKDLYLSKYPLRSSMVSVMPIIPNEQYFRLELLRSLDLTKKSARNLGLNGKKVLLFVGRIVKEKGVDLLIEAFSKLGYEDYALIIVGSNQGNFGSVRDSYIEIDNYRSIRNLFFVGRHDGQELISYYNLGGCFVLPSIYEPFGAVVAEALISGLHVVCSKYVGAATLINEFNGRLFDPTDAGSFESLLEDIYQSIEPLNIEAISVKESRLSVSFKDSVSHFVSFIKLLDC